MVKRKTKRLKFGQDEILETGGLLSGNIPFKDDAEMEAAWFANRDWLMPDYIKRNHGWRPYAWWKFEAKRNQPPAPDEPGVLQEMGLLSKEHKRYWASVKRIRAGKAPLSIVD